MTGIALFLLTVNFVPSWYTQLLLEQQDLELNEAFLLFI